MKERNTESTMGINLLVLYTIYFKLYTILYTIYIYLYYTNQPSKCAYWSPTIYSFSSPSASYPIVNKTKMCLS